MHYGGKSIPLNVPARDMSAFSPDVHLAVNRLLDSNTVSAVSIMTDLALHRFPFSCPRSPLLRFEVDSSDCTNSDGRPVALLASGSSLESRKDRRL